MIKPLCCLEVCVRRATLVVFSVSAIWGAVSCRHVQERQTWTQDQAQAWFQSGAWREGLPMKPHPSINQREFAIQYHANAALWDKAFAFLKRQDLQTLPDGKYSLDGTAVFATVSQYVPKELGDSKWESHRQYIDIQ